MLVLSSPSGAGKTSICKEILKRIKELKLSISYTTRPKRKSEVDGRDDWQGAQKFSNFSKTDIVSVFILPPINSILKERLKKRNEDSLDIVNKRMSKAKSEISHWIEYDYVLINEDLATCTDEIVTILKAERKKRDRQKFIFNFIEKLLK